MREYSGDEPIMAYAPVLTGQSPGATMSPAGAVAIGALFVGLGIYMGLTAGPTAGLVAGVPGAMVILLIVGPHVRRIAPMVKPLAFGGSLLLFGVIGWLEWDTGSGAGALLVWAFVAMAVALLLLIGLRSIQDRRIAAIMAQPRQAEPPQTIVTPEVVQPADGAPPLILRIYEYGELPPLATPYQAPVTDTHNIIGQPPFPILYLYNFYSGQSLKSKIYGDWRRFGPVYYLGSPADVSLHHTFDIDIATDVEAMLLASPDAFDASFANAGTTALPPGDKSLGAFPYITGGYPQHQFLCGDGSWQHGFERLLAHARIVLLDAAQYTSERAGLGWEIGQVIDRVACDRWLVLMDEETDRVALASAIRKAWSSMAATSPNRGLPKGVINMVHMTQPRDPERSSREATKLPAELDPAGLFAKGNLLLRAYMGSAYEDLLISDAALGLLPIVTSSQAPPPAA